MCGIFGYIGMKDPWKTRKIIDKLFILSESRGKEAAGLAISNNSSIEILKSPFSASHFINTKEYRRLFKSNKPNEKCAYIGHARLVTNGSMELNFNNQPVTRHGIVCVHNGIITNDKEIWSANPDMERKFDVDTEVFLSLVNKYNNGDTIAAFSKVYKIIKGTASVATLFSHTNYLALATNNGSLYWAENELTFMFASEEYILSKVNDTFKLNLHIHHLNAGKGILVNFMNLTEKFLFCLSESNNPSVVNHNINKKINEIKIASHNNTILDNTKEIKKSTYTASKRPFLINMNRINSLKRCSKCVLPETMPFIEFDDEGICNYCRSYKNTQIKGIDKLIIWADTARKSRKHDCLVAFSGGRDSSYGLHFIKKELGMNPVAFSYDWGVLTDLGRRNQARMCGKLGVEHIILSANIRKKRENIKKNIRAWLKRPDLGTIPLFMAGDKQYFYYLNKLKKNLGLNWVIYSENPLEKTDFKTGFCGVRPKFNIEHFYDFNNLDKIQLAFYYLKNYIANPSLVNTSLIDTLTAYLSSYFISHEYLYLYQYINWDEEKINSTLIKEYDWELASDTNTTWRIGDGTAAFYNYIYYLIAGFTENDTFRSNQIREGVIKREEALLKIVEENQPRFNSIKWYCDTIGIDYEKTLSTINTIPKLYG